MNNNIKLSNPQITVIALMRTGYELAQTELVIGNRIRCWLQEGKIGHGGATLEVNKKTFDYLRKNNIITVERKNYPSYIFQLTTLGKTIKL